jgi:D-arginine dehydrogenase
MVMRECDYLIIGAGIAGASAGYEMANQGSVLVLEREDQPGYHSTGRSAALFTENYGPTVIRSLSIASGPFFHHPPEGFTEIPLLEDLGLLFVARKDQRGAFDELLAGCRELTDAIHEVGPEEACRKVPVLDPDYVASAAFDPDSKGMDVNAIHQGFLRGMRARGGEILCDAEALGIEKRGDKWLVRTPQGEFAAPVLVNAAGAWADKVAELVGIGTIGLVPKRRTVIVFDPPQGTDLRGWPLAADTEEQWYFKREGGRFLGSPADETPVEPQDIQPEEIDMALAAERIERATTMEVGQIVRKWAGLRSFVDDKQPVVGFAPDAEGFFWLAGQGGYGIQTSAAMGRVAAGLASGRGLPDDVKALGVTEADLAPARLGT